MSHAPVSPPVPVPDRAVVEELLRDLRQIFGPRLASLVAYGEPDDEGVHTLAFVEQLTFADLAKCAPRTTAWRRLGFATPLVLTRDEFRRSLDVFPLEYDAIISRHAVLDGPDPFNVIAVPEVDLRRGCEHRAKSHLIHLREGFLESRGDAAAVARLIAASAPAFRALLADLERLEPGAPSRAGISEDLAADVLASSAGSIADPSALLARYVAAVERLWGYVDGWRG